MNGVEKCQLPLIKSNKERTEAAAHFLSIFIKNDQTEKNLKCKTTPKTESVQGEVLIQTHNQCRIYLKALLTMLSQFRGVASRILNDILTYLI